MIYFLTTATNIYKIIYNYPVLHSTHISFGFKLRHQFIIGPPSSDSRFSLTSTNSKHGTRNVFFHTSLNGGTKARILWSLEKQLPLRLHTI